MTNPVRLQSLDAFRGITVAAMILVNNPGSWSHVYPPLLHAPWHGCTPTDLVFPFFLFIVGMSIHFAYKNKLGQGLSKPILFKIAKRSVLIIGLGIFLSLYPKFDFTTVRIPGVLQRIGLVFFVSSILYFKTDWLGQIRTTILLLTGYYILMTFVPVPGFGAPNLDAETNFGAWFDRLLLEGHLWSQSKTWDPEGIISTIPAIATAILGMLTGQLITKTESPSERTVWMFFMGACLIFVGLAWGLFFPLNKALWTSSFVCYTAGIALQVFAIFYWAIDVKGYSQWAKPLVYYGTNALFVFVASGLLAKTMGRIKISLGDGTEVSLWNYLYTNLYASWVNPTDASLLMAMTLVAFFLVILRWMYNKNLFIKI